ncbi:MAG: signal peptidase II [Candidatus Rokubacteria bacterium 13_1_40CM_69_27]|nr:MAG: signal peptidase II [Candidatus Rokubacteria bacterium 13_1_40CM_69_27]OLC34092.1 MAG: signal peptidase II [Candidatus Rokubacteria bacterium 13_1_40CM_4_69_5]
MTAVLVIAGVVAILDQLTKAVALDRLAPGVPVQLIDGLLALTLVKNEGLAFGLLAGLPPAWRWIVVALSLGALLVLARVAVGVLTQGAGLDQAAIGLIFGGAVGNLIDRARFGAVVDFVDVYYRGFHWPAFNAADSAITIGVVLLALRLLAKPSARAA